MCGICGIFDAQGSLSAGGQLVRRMAAAIAHRGPDNDGFYESPHCHLGHRRLRIIDLSPLGHQPMTNEDGSLWVSFNGEIYNYLELRPMLEERGHHFRSQTDTEVLLHLYEDEGEDFLKPLNGMFAVALWDARRRRLLLARDRFGKKPIYYYSDGRRLLFGSELKSLLADPEVPRELDPQALLAYLSLGYVPAPMTVFRGISKLPPASWLSAEVAPEGGRLHLRGPERFWSVHYRPDFSLTEEDCVVEIRRLLRDATRIRLFSDVPLGAFLSGGLDSSAVVAMMAEASSKPVETFSIGFDQASHDELEFAEQVARRFRTRHHTFRCHPDALAALPVLVHHFDEPFGDDSAIPMYYVSKIAREHVTVALSGDGGDELFAGYARYEEAMRRQRFGRSLPAPLARGFFRVLANVYPRHLRGWGILNRHSLAPIDAYQADLSLFLPQHKAALVAPDGLLRGATSSIEDDPVFARTRRLAEESGANDLLTAMQYVDQMLYLPEDILVKVDRASMAVALEARAPLLDYRLAEFLATVPADLRFHNGTKKYLLRQAMHGILPEQILTRSKMGFGVPLRHWFRKESCAFAEEVLLSPAARQRGLFREEEVRRILSAHRGGRDMADCIWALIFFELWCRAWLDTPPSAGPHGDEVGVTRCAAL
jgi:asparagine synthase (glutamine-hydrolysing)